MIAGAQVPNGRAHDGRSSRLRAACLRGTQNRPCTCCSQAGQTYIPEAVQATMDSRQRHGAGRKRSSGRVEADAGEGPRVSCEETRSLCSRRQADQDRISDWHSHSCRQSISPSTTVDLNELSATVQHRVRGHHMIWTFRDEESLMATIIVDAECHPVSQLHRFTFSENYTGRGFTQLMWEYVEGMLLSLQFEEVLYDAARHLTDDEMRGSLGKFYEMQGVNLEDVKRTDVGPMVDRWTVQNPSDVRQSDLEFSNPNATKALSVKLPDISPLIPEGTKHRLSCNYRHLLTLCDLMFSQTCVAGSCTLR
jgi:hypothetical protein